ncbi:MAG: hypothetical protein GY831_10380 [Delftia sp.]|nr:hypothetical protein [Delftia sp.]
MFCVSIIRSGQRVSGGPSPGMGRHTYTQLPSSHCWKTPPSLTQTVPPSTDGMVGAPSPRA